MSTHLDSTSTPNTAPPPTSGKGAKLDLRTNPSPRHEPAAKRQEFKLSDFTVERNVLLRPFDHLGITGSSIKPRRRINAELARFAVGNRTLSDQQHDLVSYALDVEKRDVDSAWTALNEAKRINLGQITDEGQRRMRGRALRAEADQKLTGWRQSAAAAAIGLAEEEPDDDAAPVAPTAATLVEVQKLIDEHNDNRYRQLAIHARSLRYIGTLVVAALVAFGLVVVMHWLGPNEGGLNLITETSALSTLGSYIGVVVLGAMGALLSVLLSRMAGPDANPHKDLSNRVSGYVRPLLGGLSAVVVVLILESGIQSIVTLGENGILVGALLAGFSERLIDRALGGIAA